MKAKLLVVDDDHSVLASLKKLLEAEHYEVYPARDAAEAIESFKANRIDLVILDINLGVENGWKVFQDMTVTKPFVPTIIITAEWGQREKAVALGVEGLIEKPIDVPVFLEMIRDLLAVSTGEKHKRICGSEEYCRYVARHYEPYLRLLQERYETPFKMASSNQALPTGHTDAGATAAKVIPASTIIQGQCQTTGSDRTPSPIPGLTHSFCENNPNV